MLEDPKINIKLELSALWTALLALYIYGDYFELYVPGKAEQLLEGTSLLDSPAMLLFASIVIAIPALMIALSILMKPQINRILNIVVGSLLTILVVLVGSSSLKDWYSFYVLYAVLEAVITIFIVWRAWNWPKKLPDSAV